VVRYLEERGVGFDAIVARVPIVTAAVLFDLGVGDPSVRPGPAEGYVACRAAAADVTTGNAGAGTGATVAKLHGLDRGVKGGIGTASVREGDVVVGAIAAVNALGEIVEDDGSPVAMARPAEGDDHGDEGEEADEGDREQPRPLTEGPTLFGTNTTLVVVATNARLSKERAHLLSLAGHEGIDRAVRPAHTKYDGDTVFALATGQVEADQRELERLAADVVAEAIRHGVRRAEGILGFPSAGDPS
jgi:L-aminopeptidase/D-esterase-like protein